MSRAAAAVVFEFVRRSPRVNICVSARSGFELENDKRKHQHSSAVIIVSIQNNLGLLERVRARVCLVRP